MQGLLVSATVFGTTEVFLLVSFFHICLCLGSHSHLSSCIEWFPALPSPLASEFLEFSPVKIDPALVRFLSKWLHPTSNEISQYPTSSEWWNELSVSALISPLARFFLELLTSHSNSVLEDSIKTLCFLSFVPVSARCLSRDSGCCVATPSG